VSEPIGASFGMPERMLRGLYDAWSWTPLGYGSQKMFELFVHNESSPAPLVLPSWVP